MKTALIFAYSQVGMRCLAALYAQNVDILLVVTHANQKNENIWFDSVQAFAQQRQLPCIQAESVSDSELLGHIQRLAPDFIFSFYYRNILPDAVLACAKHGAYNMHGALLPKYRGRACVNWAILQGETKTGVTLHKMTARPDAGDIVDQEAVWILPDDSATLVMQKISFAAENTMMRTWSTLSQNTAKHFPQDLTQGSYFGGRKPEDGRLLLHWSAQQIHNCIRALAPPYPGAFILLREGEKLILSKSLYLGKNSPVNTLGIFEDQHSWYWAAADQKCVEILEVQYQDQILPRSFWADFFKRAIVL